MKRTQGKTSATEVGDFLFEIGFGQIDNFTISATTTTTTGT